MRVSRSALPCLESHHPSARSLGPPCSPYPGPLLPFTHLREAQHPIGLVLLDRLHQHIQSLLPTGVLSSKGGAGCGAHIVPGRQGQHLEEGEGQWGNFGCLIWIPCCCRPRPSCTGFARCMGASLRCCLYGAEKRSAHTAPALTQPSRAVLTSSTSSCPLCQCPVPRSLHRQAGQWTAGG